MSKKKSCDNTQYTDGFKITKEIGGPFVAVKGKIRLQAKTVEEVNELIKKLASSKKPGQE